MVGATLAKVLANGGYKVALVEAHVYDCDKQPSFDDRAIALSWGSSRILQSLHLWSEIRPLAEPIKTIHISDRGHFGLTRIVAKEERVPALGYVVPANDLGAVLVNAVSQIESDSLQLLCPAQLVAIEPRSDSVKLQLQLGSKTKRINSKLVIAADGAQSTARALLGIGHSQHDYHQDAIIANVTPELDHQNTAYERFTEAGPIAMLPMRSIDNHPRCALVWTVPGAVSQELIQVDEKSFLSVLQKRFGYRLGHLRAVGQRSKQQLSLTSSSNRIAQRVVFIGNAAQALHPVAGQGFNLALRDMSALLDCLLYPGSVADPGNSGLLNRFTKMRKLDQQRVIYFTDSLINIFCNNLPLFSQARAAALTLLDSLPPLRRKLIHLSMGLDTALPRI